VGCMSIFPCCKRSSGLMILLPGLIQDPAQAEALLGPLHARIGNGILNPGLSHSLPSDPNQSTPMTVDSPINASSHPTAGTPGTPAFSTPIKLAPSTSAFKRSGSKASTPQDYRQGQRGWGPKVPNVSASASAPAVGGSASAVGSATDTPNKGMLGQVSDLIFGW
jgi:hypothetical protein